MHSFVSRSKYPRVTSLTVEAWIVPAMPVDYLDELVVEVDVVINRFVRRKQFRRFGKLQLKLLSTSIAQVHKIPLRKVCNSHSCFLLELYDALFDRKGEPRKEFNVSDAWSSLLILDELKLVPEVSTLEVIAETIRTTSDYFGPDTIVVADIGADFLGLHLTDKQVNRLGFDRIPGLSYSLWHKDTMKIRLPIRTKKYPWVR
jgi:hypothetical protein